MLAFILHATHRETHRVEEGMAVQIHGVVLDPNKSAVNQQVVVRVGPPICALALKVEFTFHVTKPVWFGIETTAVGSVVDGGPSGLAFHAVASNLPAAEVDGQDFPFGSVGRCHPWGHASAAAQRL